MKSLLLAAAVMAGLMTGQARAEDRPLCANRPGKGSPPCVLDQGRFQVETSAIDVTRDRAAGVTTTTTLYGDLALRYGLTPRLELELAVSPYVRVRESGSGGGRISGAGDLTLTFRQSLANPDGSGVSIALQPFVTAPTGRDGIGAPSWRGGVALPVSISLDDATGLGFTPQVQAAPDATGDGTHLAASLAVGISRSLGAVSLAAELWAQRDQDPSGHTTSASLDLSAAWIPQAAPDLQLDLGVYRGLNRDIPDLEAYVGLSRRF